jgi:hypothetical protein
MIQKPALTIIEQPLLQTTLQPSSTLSTIPTLTTLPPLSTQLLQKQEEQLQQQPLQVKSQTNDDAATPSVLTIVPATTSQSVLSSSSSSSTSYPIITTIPSVEPVRVSEVVIQRTQRATPPIMITPGIFDLTLLSPVLEDIAYKQTIEDRRANREPIKEPVFHSTLWECARLCTPSPFYRLRLNKTVNPITYF